MAGDQHLAENFQGDSEIFVGRWKSRATIESYMGDIRKYLEWFENKQGTFEGQLSRVSITKLSTNWSRKLCWSIPINKKRSTVSIVSTTIWSGKVSVGNHVSSFPIRIRLDANGSEKESQSCWWWGGAAVVLPEKKRFSLPLEKNHPAHPTLHRPESQWSCWSLRFRTLIDSPWIL